MNTFCTVVTRSHLTYVMALAESLITSGNSEPLQVLVVDADKGGLPDDQDHLKFIGFDAVADELPPLIRHYFDAFELCNALKPYLVTLLITRGASQVIYLDSDLLVTGSFSPVWTGFGNASLQMTPHHLAPPDLGTKWVSEVEIVDMGFLNGGFSAWRAGPACERMLAWLRSRLPVYGFCDRAHGMFVDQKLMPLLLQYYPDDVTVLRNPRLNIAFWNARERLVEKTAENKWSVAGEPVVFFHLSGYRLGNQGRPCAYLPDSVNTAILRDSPWMHPVLAAYHARLERHFKGHHASTYPFNEYDGVKLNADYRSLLFRTGVLDRRSYAFWRIRIREQLKFIKRKIVALIPRQPAS